MRGQHDNFIALLQRTTDDLLKNRLHSSLVRQIVIQDMQKVFRYSLKGKIKKTDLSVKVFSLLSSGFLFFQEWESFSKGRNSDFAFLVVLRWW